MNTPDFSNKCISFTIQDDESNYDLFDPRFEEQCGKLFIIGTIPKGATESNWVSGKTGAVAWERVTNYYVFDSIEEYTIAINASESFQEKNETT